MAVSEKAIEFLGNSLATGKAVPGQSLTNSPEDKYKWESPPEFSNHKEASLYVFSLLTTPETVPNLLESVANGVGIIDLASIVLYSGFLEGKWNPDLMALLMEPTMYMIMALAEKANIKYVVDSGDDEQEPEITSEQQEKSFKKGLTALEEIKKETVTKINPQAIPVEIREKLETIKLPKGLLDRKEKPESLLNKEDV
jgi:hypothetical protein|tara:strand:- start:5683 stop:6276 length:594 start_codon:yes stop_codon:yes gene_type:complete